MQVRAGMQVVHGTRSKPLAAAVVGGVVRGVTVVTGTAAPVAVTGTPAVAVVVVAIPAAAAAPVVSGAHGTAASGGAKGFVWSRAARASARSVQ